MAVDRKYIYSVISKKNQKLKNLNMNITSKTFEDICKSYSFQDDTTPFVLAYSTELLRVFVTSSSALSQFSKSTNMHIDSTYKLNIYRFIFIVLGFTDS